MALVSIILLSCAATNKEAENNYHKSKYKENEMDRGVNELRKKDAEINLQMDAGTVYQNRPR